MEELLIQKVERSKAEQDTTKKLEYQAQALIMNLQNHIGNKVKISFLPNQYYNEKIYTLTSYDVTHDSNGIKINLNLKEGSINVNYKVEDVINIMEQTFFNRIEYKAYTVQSGTYEEVYNFCLYF